MDLIDALQALSARIETQLAHVQTEEATKNALILPFINALGYNVFDLTEVVPEYNADASMSGLKKGEKVDYVIKRGGEVLMLIECKTAGADMHESPTAMSRATSASSSITTTGSRFAGFTSGRLGSASRCSTSRVAIALRSLTSVGSTRSATDSRRQWLNTRRPHDRPPRPYSEVPGPPGRRRRLRHLQLLRPAHTGVPRTRP